MRTRTGMALAILGLAAVSSIPLWAGGLSQTTLDPAAPIPDASGGVFSACQTITVVPSAGEDIVGTVTVNIAMAHSWVGDITYRLTSPSASVLTLMNRPGRVGTGFGNDDNLVIATPILFSDTAASGAAAETMGSPPCAANIGTPPNCPDNYIPSPDAADSPIPGVGTNLAQFTGTARNGVWQLCAADSAGGDTGTLSSWTINFLGSTPVELQSISVE